MHFSVRNRQDHKPPPMGWLALTLLFLLPMALSPADATAQATITGTVTEAGTQRPLVNAQISIQGTSMGSLTNSRGVYTISGNIPIGEVTVRAELIGFRAVEQETSVSTDATVELDFQLAQTTLALDQIVVTGAGVATERRRLGNTIATIDVGELETSPISSMSEMLGGREPGVVGLTSGGMAGEGSRIRIRGSASLSQSNEPVIYVDGVRVDAAGGFGPGVGAGGGGAPSRLDDINPESIERIEILKGAAAATLYGTQASNGVIQIFTKRGQSGAASYTFGMEQGLTRYPLSRIENHAGFVTGQTPSSRDQGVEGVRNFWGLDVQPYEPFEVNMIPQFFGTGHAQTYSGSITGGTQALTYYVSGRYHLEDGPYDGSAFQAPGFRVANDENWRAQFNANMELFPMEDLRVRVSSSYTEGYHSTVDNNNNIFGVLSSVLNSRPERATASNITGSPAFATARENFHRLTDQDVQRFGGALTAAYQVSPSLAVDGTVGIDFVNQRSSRFFPFGWNVDNFTNSNILGARTVSDRNHREVTLDVKGRWNTGLGDDWTLDVTAGGQGFLTQTKSQVGSGNEFPGPGLEVTEAGALQSVQENFSEQSNVGLLGEGQFGFRDFAFFTVGGRFDQHSAFGETSGGAFYPKVSTSVIPSQLDGWNSDLVSTLRIRAALGQSGLQPGAFDQFTTFSPLASLEGSGVAPDNLGNPDLRPEVSLEWELGSEVGVFQDRASLDFTYWNRTVTDVLVDRQFPTSGGFRFPQLDNIGEMKSWGLEFGADMVAVTRPNFSANVFANAAFIREEITDLGDAPALKVGGSYARYRQFTEEGYHPGAFFGPFLDESVEFPGHLGNCQPLSNAELTQLAANPINPGDLEPYVLDCGTPEMLLHYIGKPVPDWQGSFGANMTFYGNFSLNTLFEYRFGNFHIHDLDGAFRRQHPLIGRNNLRAAQVEATMLNPNSTTEQRVEAANTWVRELQGLSPYDGLNEIHEADWLRLREVSLTYRFSSDLAERFGASNLSVTAAGRNLALWTKFPGTDPELNFASRGDGGGLTNNFGDGVVAWGVPLPRRVSFAVRASF